MPEALQDLERIRVMGGTELREFWRKRFGEDPPATQSRELLRWEIAWRLQTKICGDLSSRTRRRIRDLLDAGDRTTPPPPVLRLRPGTSLVRKWKGKNHDVQVTASGFVHDGTEYKTLSAVARAITGTQWSGPAFFGLKKRTGAA